MRRVSVVVPAHNAAATLGACLNAIRGQTVSVSEVIVYDDGSTDGTAAVAEAAGVTVLRNAGAPQGPAFGRNAAASRASGEFLLFVDADVVLAPNALEWLSVELADSRVVAVVGSYDDAPSARGVASRYMNLRHHFVHQAAAGDIRSFWTGIGLVQRTTFLSAGGFDHRTYRRPSIEDVELGARLAAMGHGIRLAPRAQGKHLKAWSLGGAWKTDIWARAAPWSRLIVSGRAGGAGLNLSWAGRLSFLCTLAVLAGLAATPIWRGAGILVLAALGTYLLLNLRFFVFLRQRLPIGALAGAMAMHFAHHLLAGLTFAAVWAAEKVRGDRRSPPSTGRSSDPVG